MEAYLEHRFPRANGQEGIPCFCGELERRTTLSPLLTDYFCLISEGTERSVSGTIAEAF